MLLHRTARKLAAREQQRYASELPFREVIAHARAD